MLLVIIIAVISFKCQKELSRDNTIPAQSNNQSLPITSTLQGNVLDENGQPAAGVKISSGSKITTTNSHGYFRIIDALLDKSASPVTAEQSGYFKAYRTFRATTGVNQIAIKLIKKTLSGTVNAITGGEVTLANGAKVSLPANGVTKATGGTYTGDINVYTEYIDPTSNNISITVPGSFMGDDKDKKRVVLSSYGMLAVEIESSTGEKLQIAGGKAATLTMPIPSSILSSAPASISLWYIDEQTGIWKEQGKAKKNGSYYVGEVNHFSYWNCDIGLPAISFSATFKTSDDLFLTNMHVIVRLVNDTNNGFAHGYTDSLGQVSGLIPANANLVLEVFDLCSNIIYSKNIGPVSENTNLGTIIIPNSVPSLTTIKGKLLSCSNTPVSNGYATIYFNNLVYYVSVNDNGEFSANIFTCTGTPQTCEILGVDETTQQQGILLAIPLTSQVTDAGDINACGMSSSQFINYTLDGTDHIISNSANDSLVAFNFQNSGTSFMTYVAGTHSTGNHIRFDFTGDATAGVYPLNSLNVINFNRVGLTKPFNVTITAFPQHQREFYEGSFSGTFKDSSDVSVTHNISCSFRIKKY